MVVCIRLSMILYLEARGDKEGMILGLRQVQDTIQWDQEMALQLQAWEDFLAVALVEASVARQGTLLGDSAAVILSKGLCG